MASRESVTLAMALTTTTGRSANRPWTMWATRSIAFASCTEVPPNFITIMGGGSPCRKQKIHHGGTETRRKPPPKNCVRDCLYPMESHTVSTVQPVRGQHAELPRRDSASLRVSVPPWWIFPSPEIPLRLEKFRIEQRSAGGAANCVVREDGELPVEDVAGTQAADRRGHACAEVNVEARLRTVRCGHIHDRLLGCAREAQLLRFGAKIVPGGDELFRRGLLL